MEGKRGRPFGVSGKYKDNDGNPIGVMEYRQLLRDNKKNNITTNLQDFKETLMFVSGMSDFETEEYIIGATISVTKSKLREIKAE